jgi:fatty acid desaturase
MTMSEIPARGEEFRDDLRPLAASPAPRAGVGKADARRVLAPAELAPLTELSDLRSLIALSLTVGITALAIAFGVMMWPSAWVVLPVLVVGVQQHALFILAHESAPLPAVSLALA